MQLGAVALERAPRQMTRASRDVPYLLSEVEVVQVRAPLSSCQLVSSVPCALAPIVKRPPSSTFISSSEAGQVAGPEREVGVGEWGPNGRSDGYSWG